MRELSWKEHRLMIEKRFLIDVSSVHLLLQLFLSLDVII